MNRKGSATKLAKPMIFRDASQSGPNSAVQDRLSDSIEELRLREAKNFLEQEQAKLEEWRMKIEVRILWE